MRLYIKISSSRKLYKLYISFLRYFDKQKHIELSIFSCIRNRISTVQISYEIVKLQFLRQIRQSTSWLTKDAYPLTGRTSKTALSPLFDKIQRQPDQYTAGASIVNLLASTLTTPRESLQWYRDNEVYLAYCSFGAQATTELHKERKAVLALQALFC